ncbi:MAG TPA: hypothetical protein VEY12_05690 [Thermoplasmata archaeon]|nr:hypothetical protein [Thermoplasmata archaeon]
MPSLLEIENRVKKLPVLAWAVFVPTSPRDRQTQLLMAGGDAVKTDVISTKAVEAPDGRILKYVRSSDTVWQPEVIQRLFLKGWPEPIYREEDVYALETDGHFRILRTEHDRDAYIAKRKLDLEEERQLDEAKRLAAEKQFLADREQELAKIRGEP